MQEISGLVVKGGDPHVELGTSGTHSLGMTRRGSTEEQMEIFDKLMSECEMGGTGGRK